uniref:ATP synthase protein 8 n=1 Tax=Orbilia brochopaga TaxID=3140254 RepID=A0A4Y5MZU4_9PEZI|nr:ATP synthase F0 subunit 8 [Drechslerella brochopaga]
MPQLVPFYFINQVTFVFIILMILIYVFSKFILPHIVRTFITRIYLNII